MNEQNEQKNSRRYGRVIAVVLAVLVVAVAAVIAIRIYLGNIHEINDNRPVVRTEVPQVRDVYVYTEQIGSIQPAKSAPVIPMMAGEILEVNFNAGDEVKEGDVLVVVNSDALKSYGIQVDSAKIQMDDALANLERSEALFASGAVSQVMLDQARSAAEGAKLAYEAAQTTYDLQQKYANITAPISGTIEYRNAEVHNFVTQGSPVAVISETGKTSVSFGIAENSLRTVKAGDKISIGSLSDPVEGTITEIGSMAGQSGLYPVKAEIDSDREFNTGERVVVTVLKDKAEGSLTIPLRAVYHAGGEAFVYVVDENGHLVKKTFEAGIDDGEYITVLGGLESADNVVCTWSRELYDGAEVIVSFEEK